MSRIPFLPPLSPFLFSVLAVSGLASKALHLTLHFKSIPFLHFVLYSPTLVLPDLLVILCVRLLLQFQAPETWLQWLSTCLGDFLSLVTWGASAIQIGFFMQTGAEVAWAASNSFVSDPAAMRILLSGVSTVSAVATVLALVALALHSQLYYWTGLGLRAIWDLSVDLCVVGVKAPQTIRSFAAKTQVPAVDFRSLCRRMPVVAVCVSLLFLEMTRPSVPYDHLSGALPCTLLDALHTNSRMADGCRAPALPFPLWDEARKASFSPMFTPDSGPVQQWIRPSWLPNDPPSGFTRLDLSPEELQERDNHYAYVCGEGRGFYDPKEDPLKISNLGNEVFEPLQKVFKGLSVEIEHIVLLTLESGRKEMFPMQPGTPMFDGLLASHKKDNWDEVSDRLVSMTPVAQILTGEYVTNSKGRVDLSNATWLDSAEKGMGGINVRGALSESSLTFKSIVGSHCGVHPLPVDLLEEAMLDIYQPCLPQIFELFNEVKARSNKSASTPEAWNHPWKSVFMQSITDDYDRQDILNDHMGFKHKVVRSTLKSPSAKYEPEGEEINYFGYAETELKPYIRDLFEEAANNTTRMFFSHVTSTTHHPWTTPENFTHELYMGKEGKVKHDLMNDYLNSARFVDNWIGDIMGMLDDAGIANSTLVVIVGDHGQAFGEDNKDMTGTYENGHISNFRVPLILRHPHMPRIDISANATALTIVPTILDLLIQSHSLDERDTAIASGLLPEYQGQSLLRPFLQAIEEPLYHHTYEKGEFREERASDTADTEHEYSQTKPFSERKPDHRVQRMRSVWNMGMINAGGSVMVVSSADTSYRLILPLKQNFEYTFTHLGKDPGERDPLNSWTLDQLVEGVLAKHGVEAAAWLEDAEQVGRWWINEQKRVWGYREA